MSNKQYKRILVKLSGEFFSTPPHPNFGCGGKPLNLFLSQIKSIKKSTKLEIGIVVGAGNIIRGINAQDRGIDRYTSDYMGMIGTLINALYLKDILSKSGIESCVMSALEVKDVCLLFSKERALKLLEKDRTIIFAGGTGNPYFTTDTAAALRAIEIEADILLKVTKVDGVYDSDPVVNPKAKKFNRLTYQQVIEKDLKVMDLTAISLCKESKLPIVVFDIQKPDSIKKLLKGERVGTVIK